MNRRYRVSKETMSSNAPATDRWKRAVEALDEGSRWVLLEVPKLIGLLAALSPLALAAGIVAVGLWWFEHDAHIRQGAEIEQVQKQTEARVADLQKQAEQAIRSANQERAERIMALESQRRKLESNAADLRQRLAALQGEEQAQVAQVAALSGPEVAKQVAARLGLGPDDLVSSGAEAGSETPRQTGAEFAGNPDKPGPTSRPSRDESSLPAGGTPPPEPPSTPSLSFGLGPEALRRVDMALVQLDNCQKQATVRDQQVSTCQQQTAAQTAIIDQQKASIGELNTALVDKDKIITERDHACQQQLKLARGTFVSRVAHTLEHVAIGVAIGVAIIH